MATRSWDIFTELLKISEEVLGFRARKQRDWFDGNDPLIKLLLHTLHNLHINAVEHSTDNAKAELYLMCKHEVQTHLCDMHDNWWKAKAAELQTDETSKHSP